MKLNELFDVSVIKESIVEQEIFEQDVVDHSEVENTQQTLDESQNVNMYGTDLFENNHNAMVAKKHHPGTWDKIIGYN